MKKLLISLLCMLPMVALAGQFAAPEAIELNGKEYRLVFKNAVGNQEIYEYTAGGEPVENWTSLLTLHYASGIKANGAAWSKATVGVLARVAPKPYADAYAAGDQHYIRTVYLPSSDHPDYESNVQRAYPGVCGGLVVFQYAEKHAGDASKQEVIDSNKAMAQMIEGFAWQPECVK